MNFLFPCKNCQKQVAQEALFCPRCGIKEPAPKNEFWMKAMAIVSLISLVIIFPNNSEWFNSDTPPPVWAWLPHFGFYISLTVYYFNFFKKIF